MFVMWNISYSMLNKSQVPKQKSPQKQILNYFCDHCFLNAAITNFWYSISPDHTKNTEKLQTFLEMNISGQVYIQPN